MMLFPGAVLHGLGGASAALLIALAFAMATLALHLVWLGSIQQRVDYRNGWLGKLQVNAEIILSQLVAAFIFTFAYYFGVALGLGQFEHDTPIRYADVFAFSMINITTLGLGDILVSNHLRQIAGVQSLTGFLMLSCSAQLVWQTMKGEVASAGD